MPAGKQAWMPSYSEKPAPVTKIPTAASSDQKKRSLPYPKGCSESAGFSERLSEVSRKIWLRVSAQEWAASASIELDNVIRPAMVLPMAMIVLADSASSTVPLLSEAMVAAYP